MDFAIKKEVKDEVSKALKNLEKIGLKTSKPILSIESKEVYRIGSPLPIYNTFVIKGKIYFSIPDDLIEVKK